MTKPFEELSPEGKINRLHEDLAELRAILTRIEGRIIPELSDEEFSNLRAVGGARLVRDSFGSEFSVGVKK